MHYSLPSRQRGVTALGWMTILAVLGFFIMLGLKIVPIYLDHYRVRAVMESLKDEPLMLERGPEKIRQLMKRRLKINYVWDFDDKNVRIAQTKKGFDVHTKFDSSENIVGNLDVVVHFDHTVSLSR